MTRKRRQNKKTATSPSLPIDSTAPFMEHVAELRRRLFYIVLSIVGWSAVGYAMQHQLMALLLAPSHGQKFIYTSPIGGMNFLFKIAIYMGIALSLPVIVYQLLRYLEPLMKKSSSRFIFWGSAMSGLFALAGVLFGYYVGLPAALHFLLNQFITSQVTALLTIENYLSFVTMYMFGAALMFQIPLIVLFINRVTPLRPSQLMKKQRWVILSTIMLAFIMNPTPSIVDQMFLAVPMILSYQAAVGIIWYLDRTRGKVTRMRKVDEQLREERQLRAQDLQTTFQVASALADESDSHLLHTLSPPVPPSDLEIPVMPNHAATVPVTHTVPQHRDGYVARPIDGSHPRPLRSKYIQ